MAFSILFCKVNTGHSNRIDSNLCLCYYYLDAAVAQVVAHLIGSEEVTGPSPVSSFKVLSFKAYFYLNTKNGQVFPAHFIHNRIVLLR